MGGGGQMDEILSSMGHTVWQKLVWMIHTFPRPMAKPTRIEITIGTHIGSLTSILSRLLTSPSCWNMLRNRLSWTIAGGAIWSSISRILVKSTAFVLERKYGPSITFRVNGLYPMSTNQFGSGVPWSHNSGQGTLSSGKHIRSVQCK